MKILNELLMAGMLGGALACGAQGAPVAECGVTFDAPQAGWTHVSEVGEACLDRVKLELEKRPDASLVVMGRSAAGEKGGLKLARARARKIRSVLVGEGIDPARVRLYAAVVSAAHGCGENGRSHGAASALYLLPLGAPADAVVDGATPVPE